ncbi:hypothetical protein [Canibacter zhoujuaniae]|uniref:hypothetical protein n=1 Tax=Canibacter zhoujuaniae TaxID=2708343 RepID=UPI00141E544A|nr:hypothetical protein [Canibacter zhoujuaniae]
MTAAKRTENENLFAQGTRPRASFSTILLFIVAAALVFGGFALFGHAFDIASVSESNTIEPGGWNAFTVFAAGLLCDAIGFWLAFSFIPGREKMALDQ